MSSSGLQKSTVLRIRISSSTERHVMTDKYFFDSNVWLYLLLEKDSKKSVIAKKFIETSALSNRIVISWQVINEVSVNLLKKGFTEQLVL
jgi:predicted nucleic acid-binding protein